MERLEPYLSALSRKRSIRYILFLLLVPVFILVTLIAIVRYAYAVFTNRDKALQIAISWDRLANVAMNGDSRETISSRAGKATDKKWACILCKLLDYIDRDHCTKSIGT